MDDKFFLRPTHDWQRRYEAIRASFVERLPASVVAERFGFSPGYINLLRHRFRTGQLDFSEPVPEGKVKRRRVNADIREKICQWRERRLSSGEITELLLQDGFEISVSTVERVLAEEGYPKLPRRTRLKIGLTVKGTKVPERSEATTLKDLSGKRFESMGGGVFLFAPFLAQLDIHKIVRSAGLPGTQVIPALSYFLSFLALKLLGTERYSHAGDHSFDQGLGLFAGLNVLPKCTALSTYSYSLDAVHMFRLQKAFIKHASQLGLYDGHLINLDFHSSPHFGDESVLEDHWTGARGRRMKGALTLFTQDAKSKLILYTAADIKRSEANDQILEFLSFWTPLYKGVKPTLIFDSKFTTYTQLAQLENDDIKFITLRRRSPKMVAEMKAASNWTRITVPHEKRKFKHPYVREMTVDIETYPEPMRQIVMRGTGREKPTFIITNDFDMPIALVVSNYCRRWRIENGISEAIKFFHLNSLSSPILVKVHFDVAMTMIADTLYYMLARHLRGFEDCDAPKLYRHFVQGKATVAVQGNDLTVTFPRRAHNPILRNVPWDRFPVSLPCYPHSRLSLRFL